MLGFKACVGLGLVRLTYKIESKKNEAFIELLKAKYPVCFSGKIGQLKGYELRLHIDKSIKPVKAAGANSSFSLEGKDG